jgi:intracellular multiplication protein IcmQ
MSHEDLSPEKLKEIADALDRVVNELPWEQSVFLKALGKKFENIRNEFKESTGQSGEHIEQAEKDKNKFALKENQLEVFVSIYSAQGADLKQWDPIITNLVAQSVSRPTYSTEKAVREMIRSKANQVNEGYVSVHISKDDLLTSSPDRVPRDKLGNILLSLKERAIKKENIRNFYHKSGVYLYHPGTLSRIGDMNLSE